MRDGGRPGHRLARSEQAPSTRGSHRVALVVHGHRDGNHPGGRTAISEECVARVRAAERAAERHGVTDVLLSGAGVPGHPSEAEQMALAWSQPGPRLWLDEESVDSAENAKAALRWVRMVDAGELYVASSWWHLRLHVYYRGGGFRGLRIRHVRARRLHRVVHHLRHELRHLPGALVSGAS